jgi:hypothetical protein
MGRLADSDFKRLEAGYKTDAAVILEKLDQLGVNENLDEDIEKAVAARKARFFSAPGPQAEIPARCPACGAGVIAGKRFCPDCGRKL